MPYLFKGIIPATAASTDNVLAGFEAIRRPTPPAAPSRRTRASTSARSAATTSCPR